MSTPHWLVGHKSGKIGDSRILEYPDEDESFQRIADRRDSEPGLLRSAGSSAVPRARDQQLDVLMSEPLWYSICNEAGLFAYFVLKIMALTYEIQL